MQNFRLCFVTTGLMVTLLVSVVGLAHVCIVTSCMTMTKARIEQHIPRKRRGSCANHDKVCSVALI